MPGTPRARASGSSASGAGEDWRKVDDVLDVWFDSGSTHAFTLEDPKAFPGLAGIDRLRDGGTDEILYLEGSDQHRGWFHSSLLESCGTRGRAPYDAVLTHGFVLDAQGRKMAKSVGNVVAPQTVIKDSGADILRLWVAASDYADDLRIGPEILKTFVETYKKLRNTIRWMLGALGHFDPKDAVPVAAMGELERLMLHRLAELDEEIRDAYETFDYKRVVSRLSMFLNTDLSAFYFDIRKDALYCDPLSSARRKAALQTIEHIFRCVTLWLAPIMAFTAEEAWLSRYPDATSVHLEAFPDVPRDWLDPGLGLEVGRGACGARRRHRRARDRAGAEARRLVARGGAGRLRRGTLAARHARQCRFRGHLHRLRHRDRGRQGSGGGVPPRRRAGRGGCLPSGPRARNARGRGRSRRSSAAIRTFPTSPRATPRRCAS